MGFLRQTSALLKKDILILAVRRWFSTCLRALVLPIAFMFFISYVRNFFLPPSDYGFGSTRPIRNLTTDIIDSDISLGGRDRIVFVNNGFQNGQIESVITSLSNDLTRAGFDVRISSTEDELFSACQSSLRGTSRCFAAATFNGSPSEGVGGVWSYTARADFSLGQQVYVNQDNNDAQIYALPFIQAIDAAIASVSGLAYPTNMNEYPFTYETRQDRDDDVQGFYMSAISRFLAASFFIGICGISYHLPGHVSSERESGMSELIDAMVPNHYQLKTQAARLFATHLAFDLVYVPGWIAIGSIVGTLVFVRTSTGLIIGFHLLTGLALTGYAMLGGVLFRRAQLSGITVLIVALVLAIVAQFALTAPTAVTALSAIFPSVNYTRFIIYLARWERWLDPADLSRAPPGRTRGPAGYLFFVFLTVQIIVYPALALLLEWALYGTSSKSRHLRTRGDLHGKSVVLQNFSKKFSPGILSYFAFGSRNTVNAVSNLSLQAVEGQILVFLGANGSGKSTTLSAIAGVGSVTSGSIDVDGTGGLGLCPQKNVLWDELTVKEHVKIFNRLKSQKRCDTKTELQQLIGSCDLSHKSNKKAKTLSGGQKRKLQLAMAYTGGSKVCCIDEVSSGLDPLSRRKLWELIFSERGKRTFLLTTHALDEADALSDSIALLSKGHLKAYGTAVELKHNYGGGYKVLVKSDLPAEADTLRSLPHSMVSEGILFNIDPDMLQRFLTDLAKFDISEYQVTGPTIEDVFLNLATEIEEELNDGTVDVGDAHQVSNLAARRSASDQSLPTTAKDGFQLTKGKGTSLFKQTVILLSKRLRILSRSYLPYVSAIVVPLITAGLTTLFLGGFYGMNCSLGANANSPRVISLASLDYFWGLEIPVGPADQFSIGQLPAVYRRYSDRLRSTNNYDEFLSFIHTNFRDVNPGGFFLGNASAPPFLAYRINGGIYYAGLAKTAFDSYLMNTTIVSQFSTFALPLAGSAGDSLQLIMYFGFAMCAYPAFFALYPTFERLRKIRALHYSNGVRPASLWLAYFIFDGFFVILVSVLAIVIFVELSDVWFAPGYLFVVFLLYGLASTLLSYIVSLFATSQLAAFAFTAGGQAVFLLIYFIMYMVLVTFSEAEHLFRDLNYVQFLYGLITPSGNLLRSLLLTLNQSQLLCRNQSFISYPGDITVYGGPILYLTLQIIIFYAFLVAYDRGTFSLASIFKRSRINQQDWEKDLAYEDQDVLNEIKRTESSSDGLRVLHVSKHFGKEYAVDDLTFGVGHGSVFALLGPNGAGKSTTISLIRGDLRPSDRISDIIIEGNSVKGSKAGFRRNLGVCPQFDAIDRMTVTEHLRFYARACGVPDVNHNVAQVITAVGLQPFRSRMAAKLSGGNQRKLSLAIAIIGNPSILLLDEPSSGMDAVAKRVMWKVLRSVKTGRSLIITTHSMEEVSALADRAGIMAKRMLAIGTTSSLRMKHGDAYHVHLVHAKGSNTSTAEAEHVSSWVHENFTGAVAENTMLHGQFKFAVPKLVTQNDGSQVNAAALILRLLEERKQELGIKYYSFSETTLEDVFLNIVGKHRIQEEEEQHQQASVRT